MRDIRSAEGKTTVEVGEAMGVTSQAVSKLERGEDPRVLTIERHLAACGYRLTIERVPEAVAMATELDANG